MLTNMYNCNQEHIMDLLITMTLAMSMLHKLCPNISARVGSASRLMPSAVVAFCCLLHPASQHDKTKRGSTCIKMSKKEYETSNSKVGFWAMLCCARSFVILCDFHSFESTLPLPHAMRPSSRTFFIIINNFLWNILKFLKYLEITTLPPTKHSPLSLKQRSSLEDFLQFDLCTHIHESQIIILTNNLRNWRLEDCWSCFRLTAHPYLYLLNETKIKILLSDIRHVSLYFRC